MEASDVIFYRLYSILIAENYYSIAFYYKYIPERKQFKPKYRFFYRIK